MEKLKAHAAISELLAEYDLLLGYARGLDGRRLWAMSCRDQAQAEASATAYFEAAHVVARYFGIKLMPSVE